MSNCGPEDFGGSDFDSGFETGWQRMLRESKDLRPRCDRCKQLAWNVTVTSDTREFSDPKLRIFVCNTCYKYLNDEIQKRKAQGKT